MKGLNETHQKRLVFGDRADGGQMPNLLTN